MVLRVYVRALRQQRVRHGKAPIICRNVERSLSTLRRAAERWVWGGAQHSEYGK
jgi:hypothetical protein